MFRRLFVAVASVAALTVVVGCGDGGESSSTSSSFPAALTRAAVTRCLSEGGRELRQAPPLAPKGRPLYAEVIFAIGPGDGHIGIVLSHNPKLSARLVRAYDHRHEFQAIATRDGRAVMLLDWQPTKADKALAIECAEG